MTSSRCGGLEQFGKMVVLFQSIGGAVWVRDVGIGGGIVRGHRGGKFVVVVCCEVGVCAVELAAHLIVRRV